MTIDMTFERREELIRRDERQEGRLEGIEEGRLEGIKEGRLEGIEEGRMKVLFELVHGGILELSIAAAKANMSEEEFYIRMQECM